MAEAVNPASALPWVGLSRADKQVAAVFCSLTVAPRASGFDGLQRKGLSKVQVAACDLAALQSPLLRSSHLRALCACWADDRELPAATFLFTDWRIKFCDNTLTCPLDRNL